MQLLERADQKSWESEISEFGIPNREIRIPKSGFPLQDPI
jgi:hypothetical protein